MKRWIISTLTLCLLLMTGFLILANHPYLYSLEMMNLSRFFVTENYNYLHQFVMTDVSRLQSQKVTRIVEVKKLSDIQNAIQEAKRSKLKISMAGAKHSQGGQTFYPKAIVLDMKHYNKMLSLHKEKKIIRVQSGATWEDIQNYLNPHHLAVSVMQSSNIFTVGGSLSANVHGRDPHYGPLIETVESFRLLTANGEILNVSRTENSELFRLVIGGFGLFGVILDVDLKVTDNLVYQVKTIPVHYQQFSRYFQKQVLSQPVDLVIGRLSVNPDNFLKEMYMTTYHKTNKHPSGDILPLQQEQNVGRNKFLIGLARDYDWGKAFFWNMQKKFSPNNQLISRNNAMRPEIKFLEHDSPQDTDILQEYFVPVDQYTSFIDEMREIVTKNDVNLINATVRYIRKNEEAYLSYAKSDGFAIVLLFNQKLSDEGKKQMEMVTRELIDASIRHDGTYYLIYQLYPSSEQLRKVYPNVNLFFQKKREYDKDLLFMNMFYKKYAK